MKHEWYRAWRHEERDAPPRPRWRRYLERSAIGVATAAMLEQLIVNLVEAFR